ncbi:type IX secretion system sortase PorU [bacterium]|nr:type IX secretion system sortase PorU [bacterium]MBU1983407.1 type IX secretion system sortase PorU [bacterium]
MRVIIAITLAGVFLTSWTFAGVHVARSDSRECTWTYAPGDPAFQVPDTVNPYGILTGWDDADYWIAEKFVQPVRAFYVVVPPGTTPHLRIGAVRTRNTDGGLPGTPVLVGDAAKQVGHSWAILERTEEWKGFRLAQVVVFLQIGDARRSQILESADLSVLFEGTPTSTAPVGREGDILSAIAVNGLTASTWWQPYPRQTAFDDYFSWPTFALYRLAVTETGIYQVTGSSLAGAGLVGQPAAKIKLFGNGGRLLPTSPDTPVDEELKENAIHMEDVDGDGVFDAEDRILFFGRGLKGADYCDETYLNALAHHSPFSTENVYFVGVDPMGSDGLRMPPITAAGGGTPINRTRVREYVDQDIFIRAPGDYRESGLIWFMASFGAQQERTFSLNLPGALGTAGTLRLDFDSREYVGQNFNVYVGSTLVDSAHYTTAPYSVPIPAGVLQPGANIVRMQNLTLPSSAATVYVNYVEIEFDRDLTANNGMLEFFAPRTLTGQFRYVISGLNENALILDVSNPLQPRRAIGSTLVDSSYMSVPRRYFASNPDRIRNPVFRGAKTLPDLDYSQLRDPLNGAGIILLTYDEWYDALDSLKQFHESYREEPLSAVRVRLGDVFDEFGWGVRDPVAIRNFLKYAYFNWHGSDGTDTVKYVLFVGDGDYDYRNIESSADANWMPPWESNSNSTDDFFTLFSNSSQLPWLLAGRWPSQSRAEVETAVSKTIAYATHPLYGPWKNTASFAADDENKVTCWTSGSETQHTQQAENLINDVLPEYFTFNKLYEIFYPMKHTPVGPVKPDATRDLIEAINRGTLIINYAGHGNERIWSDEQLFVMERDRNLLNNYRMWPLFLAATCSWGAFDKPLVRCFPEELLADPRDGAVACVAATRFTYIAPNNTFTIAFYSELFRQGLASRQSFGHALLVGKATRVSNVNLYHLFGDPVLRLATPEYFAQVTVADDSLRALSLFTLSGEVSRSSGGPVWSDFQGVVEVRVFDTEDSLAYYWCDNTNLPPYYVGLPGNAIFRGRATVQNGRFDSVTFRVPRDVRYGGNNAKISLYFFGKADSESDSADGIGIREHIPIAAQASSETDTIAPEIRVWLETASFRPGDLVSATPKLHVAITDASGVNLSGEVGHKITVRIDDAQTEDLTPFFNYELDSHRSGSLDKIIGPLAEGEHRLTVEAWDSFNNLNQTTLTFTVGAAGEAGYAIRDVYNWPNPMNDVTYFTYYLTQENTRRVRLRLFTLSGKLVYEMDGLGTAGPAFNSNSDRPWDGRDREGHLLANGVYFYKIKAEHAGGYSAESTGKLVILR